MNLYDRIVLIQTASQNRIFSTSGFKQDGSFAVCAAPNLLLALTVLDVNLHDARPNAPPESSIEGVEL